MVINHNLSTSVALPFTLLTLPFARLKKRQVNAEYLGEVFEYTQEN